MRRTTAILYLFCWLGCLAISAQQKLYIDEKGHLSTDVVVYDGDNNPHTLRAFIITSNEKCLIDSALYHSLNLNGHVKNDYVYGGFGNFLMTEEIVLPNVSFVGSDFHDVSTFSVSNLRNKENVDMIIGANILDNHVWEINQVDSTIRMVEKAEKGYLANIMVFRGKKKYNDHHLLIIPLKIEGKSLYAVFDTAVNGIGVLKKIPGLNWQKEVFEGNSNGLFHYNARYQEKLVDAHVKASNWEITTTVKYVPMLTHSMVGNSFFSNRKYVIDYKKNRILVY